MFAVRTMVDAVRGLVAGEAAFFAFRTLVKPVAIRVEFFFDYGIVNSNAEFGGDFDGLIPRGAFHFETRDVGFKIVMV